MIRRYAVAAVASVVALVVLFTGQPSVAQPPPSVAWTPCGDGFECATVPVPLDYDRPAAGTISLALIRLPASIPAARIGSLFTNPGGPGGSGVAFIRSAGPLFPAQLRERFDIIGFDPRGIANSTPLRCFETLDEALAVLPPFPFPVTREEERIQRQADWALATACARRGGPIRDHMSTADVARDMDHLRAKLGDRQLTYYGLSYGTAVGQMYANMFPDRVRAVVIDAVLDPIAWTTGRGAEARTVPVSTRLRSDEGSYQTLTEFFRLCDAATAACAFSGNASQRYAALAQRVLREPVVVPDPAGGTLTLTYALLVAITRLILYEPAFWPDLAAFLAEVETLAGPAAALARLRNSLGLTGAVQEPYDNTVEGQASVLCSDSVNPEYFEAWRRAAANADHRYRYFGRMWTWWSSKCLPWPDSAGQDRYLGPWTARTANPVLVVGNYFDPATRYHGAVTAARLLPNSRLLSYAGWGHGAFLSRGNACIDTRVVRYLVTTQVPRAGTVCQPEGTPFAPMTAAAADRAALTAVTIPPQVRRALTPASG